MELKEIMDAVGAEIGADLKTEDGTCCFGVDDMTITIDELTEIGMVTTYAEIGDPPPQGLEKLYALMLEANHLFRGTGGATISRDSETGKFFLCRCDALNNLDADRFITILEHFVNVLEVWKKLIADYRPVVEDKPVQGEDTEAWKNPGSYGFMQV